MIEQLKKENIVVKDKFKELKRMSYEMIGELLGKSVENNVSPDQAGSQEILKILNEMSSVNRYSETRTVSSKINAVLTELTLKYLSQLIHHLLKAGEMIGTDKVPSYKGVDNLNLVSFRVTDIMRSKMVCK